MKKSDDVYRLQILDAVAKIERFVSGLDKDAFIGTEVVQSAVIMQLAVIGERRPLAVEANRRLSRSGRPRLFPT